jgi:NAD(P)-dependent dehydrogenase (short-subunit alcohol dehydrogenase family)
MTGTKRRRQLWKAGAALAGGVTGRELVARWREADLTGQVALVTGGSRGLGLAIARELAANGCRLALCARTETKLNTAAAELREARTEVFTVVCDVADEASVNRMTAAVLAHYGQIDVLFTNAGIVEIGPLADLELSDFQEAMDVMFWGTLYPILAVVPGMRARGAGRIATITSIGGRLAVPHLLPYTAAKFAAVGLSEGLAAELARTVFRSPRSVRA